MSTNYHTPIAVLAPANASTVNTPLGTIDAAIATVAGGSTVLDSVLKYWTEGECYELTSITYDGDGVLSSAVAKWADGSSGVLTRTGKNTTWNAVSAYTITHVLSGKTVTQTTVTFDSNGNVTGKPLLTVA